MQKEKILITVKTYPTLSSTYGELACTAGIKEDGSWIRIYPVPFRRLKEYYQFEKYAWIELPLEKNRKDPRPESYRPIDLSQIKHLGVIDTSNKWRERKEAVLKRLYCFSDMAELIQKAKNNELSLALFKPNRLIDFVWNEVERDWDQRRLDRVLAELKQGMLFPQDHFQEDFKIVRKLPYRFSYKFQDVNGRTGTLMIEDWEIGALFWNCMKTSKNEQEALEKVKFKYWDTFGKTDLYFFFGTTKEWHLRAPNPFVIIGLFTPPKDKQMYLGF